MSFITSKDQWAKLQTPVLLELCNSLQLKMPCQEENKDLIITKLVEYFQKKEPSLRLYSGWVPGYLMTSYIAATEGP